jgi:hypothetical protein
MSDRLSNLFYGLVVRVPGFGGRLTVEGTEGRLSRGKLIVVLAISVAIILPLVGILSDYHHGDGRDSLVIDIVWRVVWISTICLQLALVVLVVQAVWRWVTKHSPGG